MTTQSTKMEHEFETPLGIIRCGVSPDGIENSNEVRRLENGDSQVFKTKGHEIEFVSFKLKVPLYNGDTLTDSCGWIFRIEKTTDVAEKLVTYCLLGKINSKVTFDTATGENLDAIQVDNDEWTLHMGTEDSEILNSRAEVDDWFPVRLKSILAFGQSITEMRQNGFVTNIPALNKGEKMHIQYLTAYDKQDEQKVNTWLAVDEPKRKLENWVGLW
jgi:hypothetical protein